MRSGWLVSLCLVGCDVGASHGYAQPPQSDVPAPDASTDGRLRADAGVHTAPTEARRGTLALGLSHTCLLREGRTFCWGSNESGQLGRGSPERASNLPTPVPGLADVRAIASGDAHVCALTHERTVSCWGDNTHGELGDGTTTARDVPTPVGALRDVVEVRAGVAHTCARTTTQVFCWGSNGSLVPAPVPISATQLALGLSHTCALTPERTVVCWGKNDEGQLGDDSSTPRALPGPVPGLADVVSLSTRLNHTCALRADGSAWCWGAGGEGQLGTGDTTTAARPVRVDFDGTFSALAVGYSFSCALDTAGRALCWGASRTPRPAPLDELQAFGPLDDLAAGGHFGCALLAGGDLIECWGSNGYGQGDSHAF